MKRKERMYFINGEKKNLKYLCHVIHIQLSYHLYLVLIIQQDFFYTIEMINKIIYSVFKY